ncbi:carbohydrate ABC transporter permease [Pseudolysinimonas sp.]|uniref:carbohydrate ABC transporter permease n=1 Tax=Pseudolysinimonas sp. TaxID=2680009 RepID=UPI003F7E05E6
MTTTVMKPRAAPSRGVRARRWMRRSRWMAHLPLILVAAATAFPFYVMIVLSITPPGPFELPGSLLPKGIDIGPYIEALAGADLPRWLFNTFVYATLGVILTLLLASLAGYAFAKKRFRGRDALFWMCVAILMVPGQLYLIPQFLLISRLGLVDTLVGLLLPGIASVQALFLMRQFIGGIPDELLEAARIDGAGEFRIFFQIVLPQCGPVLATLGIFTFLWHWNEFLWPLVETRSPSNYTLTVGLNSLKGQDVSYNAEMAAAVITLVPVVIVFLLLQRYFIRGVMTSGIK